MTHSNSTKVVVAVTLCVTVLAGCAHDYSIERSFGTSVSAAIKEQSIRPNGIGYDGVVIGLEGAPAKAVIDRYNRSYEFPQNLGNVLTIGVGTGTTPATGTPGMPITASPVGVGGR
ncbi:MAG: hypothetical protein EBR85_01675 [Betaproteobacteria bacterium]|nr:hypothetical protein [Betaproteobacteria bacterium]